MVESIVGTLAWRHQDDVQIGRINELLSVRSDTIPRSSSVIIPRTPVPHEKWGFGLDLRYTAFGKGNVRTSSLIRYVSVMTWHITSAQT